MLSGKVYDLLSIHCRQRCAFASLYLKSTIRSLVLLMLSKLSPHNPAGLLIFSGYEFTMLFEIWHNRILSLQGAQPWRSPVLSGGDITANPNCLESVRKSNIWLENPDSNKVRALCRI